MANAWSAALLQPSLLDRLTDEQPSVSVEPRSARVLGEGALRQAVLRDLGCLFNSSVVQNTDLADVPLAACSVIAFGLPPLAGRTASGIDRAEVEAAIRQAIWQFEPRIRRDSLLVRAVDAALGPGHVNQVAFDIEAELWGHPLPVQLYLRTELDLEGGRARVFDLQPGGVG